MTDSPTRKKRFGAGICWEWMDRGACPCDAGLRGFAGWHPKLTLSASKSDTMTSSPSPTGTPCTVACMPKRIPEWIESLRYLGFIEGDPINFAILNTAYEEREEAKTLGATFSPGMKKWIVVAGQDLAPFAKWNPRVNNHAVGEVVLHNPYIDVTEAARELRQCGIHPSQMDIQGDGGEAEMLPGGISAIQAVPRASAAENANNPSDATDFGSGTSNKRRLQYEPQNAYAAGGNQYAGASKSPRFSTPRSMQTFVRQKQDEQAGGTRQMHGTVRDARVEEGSGHRDELPVLLSTAKSALVRCIGAGGVSREQKQFNEAIYAVVETLAARLNGDEKREGNDDGNTSYVNPRRAMITPTQRMMGSDGNAPVSPGTWYDNQPTTQPHK